MPSLLSRSFIFNPFGSGMETPPPSTETFPQFGRSLWGSGTGIYPPPTINPPRPLLGHQQWDFTRFLDHNYPGVWKHNPEFGLVHTGACSTCATYVEHVVAARNLKDATLTEAIKSHRDETERLVLDGYRLGISQMMDENRSLSEELEYVKMKWANLRDDYVNLWSSFLTHSGYPATSPVACVSPVDAGLVSTSPSSSSRTFVESCSHSTATALPHVMATHSLQNNQIEKPRATYASVASQRSPQVIRNPLSSDITASDPYCGPMVALRLRRDQQVQSRFPTTIQELKDLMFLAGESTVEGYSALSIIKKMCLDAHATPREEKTPIQKWILINWRNPYSSAHMNPEADIKSNPRIDDRVEVWFDYLCTHPHSWPKGVRKDSKNRPFMSDLIANRAVARMRPTESATARNDFVAQVTDMFSSPGMYRQLLEKNDFTVASLISFPIFTGPITVEDVALHFARSGVTPSMAMKNFEPWAQQYKKG